MARRMSAAGGYQNADQTRIGNQMDAGQIRDSYAQAKINADMNKAIASADVAARFSELGVYPRADSVAGAREFFAAQQKAMKKLVNDLGVLPQ